MNTTDPTAIPRAPERPTNTVATGEDGYPIGRLPGLSELRPSARDGPVRALFGKGRLADANAASKVESGGEDAGLVREYTDGSE
jgi:hypothetical protein